MFKHLIAFTGVLLFVSVLPGKAQNLTPNDTVSKEVVIVDGQQLNEKQLQRYYRQLRKDSIRAYKKIWWSVLYSGSIARCRRCRTGQFQDEQKRYDFAAFFPSGRNQPLNKRYDRGGRSRNFLL